MSAAASPDSDSYPGRFDLPPDSVEWDGRDYSFYACRPDLYDQQGHALAWHRYGEEFLARLSTAPLFRSYQQLAAKIAAAQQVVSDLRQDLDSCGAAASELDLRRRIDTATASLEAVQSDMVQVRMDLWHAARETNLVTAYQRSQRLGAGRPQALVGQHALRQRAALILHKTDLSWYYAAAALPADVRAGMALAKGDHAAQRERTQMRLQEEWLANQERLSRAGDCPSPNH
jgi:hypothetical protein